MYFRRIATIVMSLLLLAFFSAAVGIAVFWLLPELRSTQGDSKPDERILASLVALIGTAISISATVYLAHRQSIVTYDVEKIKAQFNQELAANRESHETSLERLKVQLGSESESYRELAGSATFYYYALRSASRSVWEEKILERAEAQMVEATRQLIFVETSVRNRWFEFWQLAQHIYGDLRTEADETIRRQHLRERLRNEGGKANLRYRLKRVQDAVGRVVKKELRKPD